MERMEAFDYEAMDDSDLVVRATLRDPRAVRTITMRNNQRMFRAAWSVLRHHADAEEAVQEAYLKAFRSLEAFNGQSSLSTWLVRIVLNTARDKRRLQERRKRDLLEQDVAILGEYRENSAKAAGAHSPESTLLRAELASALKDAVAKLPEDYRSVFVLRTIEGMRVSETAEALDISEDVVKTRLLRARRMLQQIIEPEFTEAFSDTLSFAGLECESMTQRVIAALGLSE